MSQIESVSVCAFDHPLEEPFEISLGVQKEASNVLATVKTEGGLVGYGEGSPIAPVTGETQASTIEIAQEMGNLITGDNSCAYRQLSSKLSETFPFSPSARFAVETAVVDAYCREIDISMAELFGGTPDSVETDITIPIIGAEKAKQQAVSAAAEGYSHLKIKTGSTMDEDIDRVLAVSEGAPDANLKVDANQGWTVAETIQFADEMRDHGVVLDLIEQPVHRDDVSGLAKASQSVPEPIAADEALFTSTDAIRIVRENAADVLNIKLGKAGLIDALAIVEIAEAANLDLMVGCMLESAVGIHTAAHVVAGTDAFDHVDLDGNRLLADDVISDSGPIIDISGPGHGINLD